MLSDMQNYLIHKVSASEIVIEVNPSSNEAIGENDSCLEISSSNCSPRAT